MTPKILDNYNLVINTDHSNPTSQKYFNKKIIKKYNSTAYTTTINHDIIDNQTAIQIFTKRGPLAFLPVSLKETSIVYSLHNNLKIKKNENIEQLIRHYNFRYNIKKIEKIASFELKSLILRSYYHNNILAFGDLLHKIHPLAGQGFNMTIRDIQELTNIISSKIELGLSLDTSVNSEFEKKTKSRNVIFSNGIDLIHEFFNLDNKINKKVLSKSVKFFGKNSFINKSLIKMADNGNLF